MAPLLLIDVFANIKLYAVEVGSTVVVVAFVVRYTVNAIRHLIGGGKKE